MAAMNAPRNNNRPTLLKKTHTKKPDLFARTTLYAIKETQKCTLEQNEWRMSVQRGNNELIWSLYSQMTWAAHNQPSNQPNKHKTEQMKTV